MREAIGGAWLFGLVITFIVFFASFLAISVNFSRAFNMKNEVVDMIEKYEGNNCKARKSIVNSLRQNSYLIYGTCPTNEKVGDNTLTYIGYDAEGKKVENGKRALYCIASNLVDTTDKGGLKKTYYKVVIFFKIDLPMMGNLTTFRVKGETASIYYPTEQLDEKCR